jgi:hypothetical protein
LEVLVWSIIDEGAVTAMLKKVGGPLEAKAELSKMAQVDVVKGEAPRRRGNQG